MYYPYLRGKQNELILLREQAKLISESKIIPIIEPVKKNLNPLNRAIEQLDIHNTKYIIIINPVHGDFKSDSSLLIDNLDIYTNLIIGIIITANSTMKNIINLLEKFKTKEIAILHQGFTNGKGLVEKITSYNISKHIFVNTEQNKLYRRHFYSLGECILIRDSFTKRDRNADYPEEEHFSDLHITYPDESMQGFGDFLIAGDWYSESGGPARAVTIHLTYLKNDEEHNMYIKHYVSISTEGVSDPGGKFLEALNKLVVDIDKYDNEFDTEACEQYKKLHKDEHFPGLGFVKKLSMQHHLEIIAKYIR